MQSQIFKIPGAPPTKESLGNEVSGNFFYRKFLSWLEKEPTVLMWEMDYTEMPMSIGLNAGGVEVESQGNWKIEFQFVRSSSVGPDKLLDGTSIIAGFIKRSYEMTETGIKESYYLSLHSRSFKGEAYFIGPQELWVQLTTLGIRKEK